MIGSAPNVKREKNLPVALTIAGSDTGGGAGIQADLKTFAALEVHGVSAITCVTAQNPRRVLGVMPCSIGIIKSRWFAVFEELPPAAAKTGMLYSEQIIRTVAEFLESHRVPLVVDPVMISTSGATLLKPGALKAFCSRIMPLATLVTPNIHEAELLVGEELKSFADLRRSAKALHERFGVAVLVKGGHLRQARRAMDVFFDGEEEQLLSAPFVRGIRTHGTGCTYSAAITALLAKGFPFTTSVRQAKRFISRAIRQSHGVGRHSVLNWQGGS
jgi:hydroxymethylpyrimidine/phosphomethylpyrimidine kinase